MYEYVCNATFNVKKWLYFIKINFILDINRPNFNNKEDLIDILVSLHDQTTEESYESYCKDIK